MARGEWSRYLDEEEYMGGFTVDALDQVFAAMQDNYKVGTRNGVLGSGLPSGGFRFLGF